jgi:hypothetical protein
VFPAGIVVLEGAGFRATETAACDVELEEDEDPPQVARRDIAASKIKVRIHRWATTNCLLNVFV